jgi:hypothetical protein
VAAVLHGTNWAKDGFWSPGGGWTIITIVIALLWTLMTSVMLFRAASPSASAMPREAAMGGTAA